MANLDLSKYGIVDVKEIVHNPSYDVLFAEETNPSLEGFEKGQIITKNQNFFKNIEIFMILLLIAGCETLKTLEISLSL